MIMLKIALVLFKIYVLMCKKGINKLVSQIAEKRSAFVVVSFLTELLTLGILFSTAVRALVVAQLVILDISL